MNVKFFLTISLCLGCLFMLFMWHSANNIHKESRLYEKQFLFKISSLESENKMELKLIDALRVDIAKNERELLVKSNLLEKLLHKEKVLKEEKAKLQSTIENIKREYEKVNKENNQWLDNWKTESQNNSDNEKSEIQKLDGTLKLLKAEHSILKAKKVFSDSSVQSMHKIKDKKMKKHIKNKELNKKNQLSENKEINLENEFKEHNDQAKLPMLDKNKVIKDNQVVEKEMLNKDDNEKILNIDDSKKQSQINAEKSDDMQYFNKNDHQAKAPVLKDAKDKSFKSSSSYGDNSPRLEISDQNKENEKSQLIKPKLSKSNNDEEKNDNIRLNDQQKEKKEEVDINRHPKIINKDSNPQVKPPVPRKELDNLKKNIKDKSVGEEQANMDHFGKPINDENANDSSNAEKREIKKRFQESKDM